MNTSTSMESKNKLRKIDISSRTYNYSHDIINTKDLNPEILILFATLGMQHQVV